MKQKPISAFFGASAKKDADGPRSTQAKISTFFGAGAKTPGGAGAKTPGGASNRTPGGPSATPAGTGAGAGAAAPSGAGADATPATRLPAVDKDAMGETSGAAGPATAAKEPPSSARAAAAAAPKTAAKATPAGGSTSKPKPSTKASGAAAAAAGGKAKGGGKGVKEGGAKTSKAKAEAKAGKAGGGKGGMKRLRKVVLEDEDEGGGGAAGGAEGLEDDVDVDGDEGKQLEDSDYEEEASGGDSDEDFSAEEEEDDDEEDGDDGDEEEASGDGGSVGVGSKRKRPPSKASGPSAKRTPAAAKAKPAAAPAATPTPTPGGARTPAAAVSGRLRPDDAVTPAGTVSKGPAAATAGGGAAGRSSAAAAAAATPATGSTAVGPYGSAGRSLKSGGGGVTPSSSVRSLRSALSEDTPSKSQGAGDVTLGVAACTDGDAARFAERMASRFPFLHPDAIRDAERRRPDHPDYDPRTLHIPPNWFKEAKVSEGQQQWWNFKAHNFDSVLLFKMGKFYEMFEMDAYVGVDVLGLAFMKGEQPHAGFPEVKYADMAESLARAGYRVVVIEQTETPEMLARRNEDRRRRGLKLCNVVDRQRVAVLSRGTLTDAEMVASRPDAAYVLAVAEAPLEAGGDGDAADAGAYGGGGAGGGGCIRIGLCAVDAASGQVLLGEFPDDEVRSALRTQLTALQPQELVLPRQPLSSTTSTVLRNGLRDPRVNVMRGAAGDWSADKTYRALRDCQYFTASAGTAEAGEAGQGQGGDAMDMDADGGGGGRGEGGGGGPGAPAPPELDPSHRWPELLRRMVADGVASRPAAMAALGGIIRFLRDCLLDRAVLPLGRFEELPALAPQQAGTAGADASGDSAGPLYMALNGAALENLEILENSDGGSAGTLLSVLDHCTTPFGRRRLRQWLCRPLGRIRDITARQDAVAALAGELAEAAGQARKMLAGVSDLERAIARLAASTVEGAVGREAANVVLYEDAGRRRVAALSGALRDLRQAHGALGRLRGAMGGGGGGGTGSGGSELLRQIVFERCRPGEVGAALEALEGATDWKEAAQTGRAVPEQGVDEEYDTACGAVDEANQRLQDYIQEVRQRLSCRQVTCVTVNKDTLLEVPEGVVSGGRMGTEFELAGNRKGFQRYTSRRLKSLVSEVDARVEAREAVLSGILQRLVVRFVRHRGLWVGLVDAVGEADALFSLAAHAMSPPDGGPMCRPRLVPPPPPASAGGASGASASAGGGGGLFHAVSLRHPAGVGGRNNGAFVPNDVCLGGRMRAQGGEAAGAAEEAFEAAPPFVLLSGPNMGGKSTLLRQVCLATVLAQVGACVPAESLTLSPVDALFVRMGARDSIMTGQSTFFIELAETAAMLARATSSSLVALDELGRGTATLDGAAVAGAVLAHLAGGVRCRGLFATHYHHLSDEHAGDPGVAVMHMACAVEGAEEEDGEDGGRPDAAAAGAAAAAGTEEVTFLYRLTPGACPKSYGTNVARLAGLPPRVVERAAEVSAGWDRGRAEQQAEQREQPAGGRDAMEVDGGSGAAASSEAEAVAAAAGSAAVTRAVTLRALAARVRSCLAAAGARSAGSAGSEQLRELRELQAAIVGAVGA